MSALAPRLLIDATDPYLTEQDLRQRAMAAKDAGLYGLCVLPGRVRMAAIMVARSAVRIRTLIGYPTGVHTPSVKALETRLTLQDGAHEIAVTPNLGYFLGGEELTLTNEIAYVAKALREVAPAKARNLAVVYDPSALQPAALDRLHRLMQRAGGRGFQLRWRDSLSADTLRSTLRVLAGRSTTETVAIQAPIPDAATAQALIDAGAQYLITPNALELV